MAIYTSSMRFTGLSGIDTDSMVDALMKAEATKLTKLQKNKTMLEWKQTAYRSVASSLTAFQSSWLDLGKANNARTKGTFIGNTVSVSTASGGSTNAVSVTSSAKAKPGTYSLQVQQLATKHSYGGGVVQNNVVSDVLDPANIKAGDAINFTLDGTTKKITFDGTHTSLSDLETELNTKLQNAFGYDGDRIPANAKVQVELNGNGTMTFAATQGHTLKITEAGSRNTAQHGTGLVTIPSAGSYSLQIQIGSDPLRTESITFDLEPDMDDAAVQKAINDALKEKEINNLSASVNNGSLTFTASGTREDYTITGSGLSTLGFTAGSVTVGRTSMIAGLGLTSGATTALSTSSTLGTALGVTGNGSFQIVSGGTTYTINYDENMTIQKLMDDIKKSGAGVELSYDPISESFKLESTNTGSVNAFTLEDSGNFLTGKLGLNTTTAASVAKDSKFTLNGVDFIRDSNNIDIADLKFTLKEITTDPNVNTTDPTEDDYVANYKGEKITIEVSKDVSKTVDYIKSFVDAYNTMIAGINTQINTNRAKTGGSYYEPLTDDEKGAMSESQIKAWEEKAQQGMLYNDDILKSITSSMRSMLYESVDLGGGKTISLYEIGITTSSNYWEGGKLVIDEDKLRAAVESRGEDVAELFTKGSSKGYVSGSSNTQRLKEEGLADRLDDIIRMATDSNGSIAKKAGIEGTYSAGDNTIYKQLKEQSTRISEMLTYLTNKETHYYSIFSKMEQAINNSNSQMSYLQSMMG